MSIHNQEEMILITEPEDWTISSINPPESIQMLNCDVLNTENDFDSKWFQKQLNETKVKFKKSMKIVKMSKWD